MASIMYKILLDDNHDTSVTEEILSNIPALNALIENIKKDDKILNKTILDLQNVNHTIFSHIITLVKYNIANTPDNSQTFNDTLIKNLDDDDLTDFILTAHHFGLEHLKQLASLRFMNILRNNEIENIRTELKIKNNFSPEDIKNIQVDNEWKEEPTQN